LAFGDGNGMLSCYVVEIDKLIVEVVGMVFESGLEVIYFFDYS